MAIHETPVDALRETLCSESASLSIRFRALFSLKHLASAQPPTPQSNTAIEAIAAAFASPSALLKHEVAYCLGQTRNGTAVASLTKALKDVREDPMVRHEVSRPPFLSIRFCFESRLLTGRSRLLRRWVLWVIGGVYLCWRGYETWRVRRLWSERRVRLRLREYYGNTILHGGKARN